MKFLAFATVPTPLDHIFLCHGKVNQITLQDLLMCCFSCPVCIAFLLWQGTRFRFQS